MRQWVRSSFGLCVAAAAVQAMSFQPLGFQSMGMGGAGVASASGSMAAYYNPALLAAHDYMTEVTLSAGVGVADYNLAENIDKLNDNDLTGTIKRIANNAPADGSNTANGDAERMAESLDILQKMSGETSGLVLTPGGAFGIQMKNFAIGVYMTSEGTAEPVIDPDHLQLIVKKNISGTDYYGKYDPATDSYKTSDETAYVNGSLDYALKNGLTYLSLKGLSVGEVPFSYGHAFDTSAGTIGIGGSLKYMYGLTYDTHVSIDTSSGDLDDSFKDKDKSTSSFGVDLGAFYTPSALPELRIGIVGKNLNTPEFDTVTGDTYKIDPMARMGIYYAGLDHWLDIALDVDLTSNETFLDDIDSQYIGGGVNVHPVDWFSFRLGAMQNMADSTLGTIVTAGLGLGIKQFQLDISAMMSTKSGYYDGDEIPRYARVNLALVSRW
ncbi:conjugal transfer protein TraF [Hydrogenimonas sp.]